MLFVYHLLTYCVLMSPDQSLTWPAWSPGYNVVVSQWPPGGIKIKMGRSGYTALTSLLSPLSTDHITVTVEQTATLHHSCIHPGQGRTRLALVVQHCLSSQSTEAANESFCYNYLVTDLCDKFSGLFIPDHESWLWWLYIPVLAVAVCLSGLSLGWGERRQLMRCDPSALAIDWPCWRLLTNFEQKIWQSGDKGSVSWEIEILCRASNANHLSLLYCIQLPGVKTWEICLMVERVEGGGGRWHQSLVSRSRCRA